MKTNNVSIDSITIEGYKCFKEKITINIKPLTILAGVNSSGKSSIMQPILLMKQTIEAAYDPGPLLLYGPYLKFSRCAELINYDLDNQGFSIGLSVSNGTKCTLSFQYEGSIRGFSLKRMVYDNADFSLDLHDSDDPKAVQQKLEKSSFFRTLNSKLFEGEGEGGIKVTRNRCFFEVAKTFKRGSIHLVSFDDLAGSVSKILYLAGLRCNPERSYPLMRLESQTAVLPGVFENYVASIIYRWQNNNDEKLLNLLHRDLAYMGIASNIKVESLNDCQSEIRVSIDGKHDANIVDVGLGVSQLLPIIVALRLATEGQIVYIEQPETHLHPKAQQALAKILMDAAKRKIKVIVETHSSLLLRSLQTIAVLESCQELVSLNWFSNKNGQVNITHGNLDEDGAYGEWPSDFDDITLGAEKAYLDAIEKRSITSDDSKAYRY